MKLADFNFELPERLIAKYPTEQRTASRMLCLNGNSGEVVHRQFTDIVALLQPNDLLVFNNTKVIPARLLGKKSTGGQVEVLIERITESQCALAHVKASKAPKPGSMIRLEDAIDVEVTGRQGALFELQFHGGDSVLESLENYGHMPLPPYIDRPDEVSDKSRYQTVYGEKPGAVAAPTAGLHFDEALLETIKAKGVNIAFVTLHVGAGTFQPVRVDNIEEHQMHAEYAEIPQGVVDAVYAAKQAGGRVVAVGTTSVRSLETAAASGDIQPFFDDTSIFIYPGYKFNVVDAMVTNFHLPESTLMMLISAFAGRDHVMDAYERAIEAEYRFFSYGDAMFIEKADNT